MAIGTGKLKRQMAGCGAFAVVMLDVEFAEHPVPIAIAGDGLLMEGEYYVPAVQFGVQYAQNKLLGHDPLKPFLRVQIMEIQSTTVDTNEMIVAYCTILSIFDALKLPLEDIVELDLPRRRISFRI
jgi:hypothetical protein